MKIQLLFALFLSVLLSYLTLAQERLLINKSGDVVQLKKGQSAISAIEEATHLSAASGCGTATFGYPPDKFPPDNSGQYALHNDVMAQWFETPASGRIDSVYCILAGVCTADSKLVLRIFHSNIYTGHGPGHDGYPLPSLSTCWGYYFNSTDPETQVAAFPEDATPNGDTSWVSTVTSGPGPSYPPIGSSIWGLTGVPVIVYPNQITDST